MTLSEEEMIDLYGPVVDPTSLSATAARMAGLNDVGESTTSSIHDTLEQRGNRYGSFEDHAKLSQQLQQVFYSHMMVQQSSSVPSYMIEAINMIMHKLARIANGDPYYDDSWRDIAGYAQLVVDILQTQQKGN